MLGWQGRNFTRWNNSTTNLTIYFSKQRKLCKLPLRTSRTWRFRRFRSWSCLVKSRVKARMFKRRRRELQEWLSDRLSTVKLGFIISKILTRAWAFRTVWPLKISAKPQAGRKRQIYRRDQTSLVTSRKARFSIWIKRTRSHLSLMFILRSRRLTGPYPYWNSELMKARPRSDQ